jgi:hypothetical protein
MAVNYEEWGDFTMSWNFTAFGYDYNLSAIQQLKSMLVSGQFHTHPISLHGHRIGS